MNAIERGLWCVQSSPVHNSSSVVHRQGAVVRPVAGHVALPLLPQRPVAHDAVERRSLAVPPGAATASPQPPLWLHESRPPPGPLPPAHTARRLRLRVRAHTAARLPPATPPAHGSLQGGVGCRQGVKEGPTDDAGTGHQGPQHHGCPLAAPPLTSKHGELANVVEPAQPLAAKAAPDVACTVGWQSARRHHVMHAAASSTHGRHCSWRAPRPIHPHPAHPQRSGPA